MHAVRVAALALLALPVFAGTVSAAEYPSAPVRVVVPYPAGGLVDIVMRVVGDRLSAELGQQFVIESRVGAGGTIATGSVARAEPDGYTLLAITDSHATNPLAFKDLPYDSVADFAPIGLIGRSPLILTVHPSVPARSVKDFVRWPDKRQTHRSPMARSATAAPRISRAKCSRPTPASSSSTSPTKAARPQSTISSPAISTRCS